MKSALSAALSAVLLAIVPVTAGCEDAGDATAPTTRVTCDVEAGRLCQYLSDCEPLASQFGDLGCSNPQPSTCVTSLARESCRSELDTITCPALPAACSYALTW